ncbi:MAG: DegT/DnrJ/EryC1/StrS family aminotransferase [Alphaproteobacteria bacterium]
MGAPNPIRDYLATEFARAEGRARLALCRPLLPTADALLPYLRSADRARWYTNHGPLLQRLESRLATHFAIPEDAAACVANGTQGMILALRALDAPEGTLCMMPAWTFAATPSAARAAGLIPYFVDVDAKSWALDPRRARACLKDAPGPVGAVIPVAPFGAPMDVAAWDDFAAETGIAVVRDAAAAFDTVEGGTTPAVVSLHATKPLAAGEGGLVLTRDPALATRIRGLANFGFEDGRCAVHAGTNAKMSEYAAAVGLAALDDSDERRALLARLSAAYVSELNHLPGISVSPGFGSGWVSSTCSVVLPRGTATTVRETLDRAGIEARPWWRGGCHAHPAFAACPRVALPVTEDLGERALGLPFSPDMTAADMARVGDVVAEAISSRGSRAS